MKQLKKRLNPVAQKFGYYTAYALDRDELVGAATHGSPIKWYLRDRGYESLPRVMGVSLTAAKLHPSTSETHDLTLRKIDPDNPRWQWHVHLWSHPLGYTEVFSHYEMRPDMKRIAGEDTAEMLGRLQIHYRPEYGRDYYPGRTDHVVEDLVSD